MDTTGGGGGDASRLVESPDDRLAAWNIQPPKKRVPLSADIPLAPSKIR